MLENEVLFDRYDFSAYAVDVLKSLALGLKCASFSSKQ
jgi:hypothetical protein